MDSQCFSGLSAAELRDKLEKLVDYVGDYSQQEQELRRALRKAVRKEGRERSQPGWRIIQCKQPPMSVICPCTKRQRGQRRTMGRSNRVQPVGRRNESCKNNVERERV